MEAHLASMQPTQVNKITSSCDICSGLHDTQYYMENPEQDFVDYASSRTNGTRSRLVPLCFVIFDLEPLSLSFDFVFCSEIFKSFPCLS
ncbi:hypothetical protein Tco_0200705 [Tanacetum coccineum]